MDKCLPFGSSISCVHFQAFLDAVAHLVKFGTGKKVTNYLDDFLLVALMRLLCDQQVQTFIKVCGELQVPINLDKTF